MHEGKHGILDGVDDIDDIFGTKEKDEEIEKKECNCEIQKHKQDNEHEHNQKNATVKK